MVEVQKHYAETTYDITGLTTRQAAMIEALLAQMKVTPLAQPVYDGLVTALRSDPTWERQEVVLKESVDFYAPAHRIYGYFTRSKEV